MTLCNWARSTRAARPIRPFDPWQRKTGEKFPIRHRWLAGQFWSAGGQGRSGRGPSAAHRASNLGLWTERRSPRRSGGGDGLGGGDDDGDNSNKWSPATRNGS
jgi:hypothetical protein